MIHTDRLDQRLRAADPAAGLDRDPGSVGARRLRARARHDPGAAPVLARSAQRRLVVAIGVGALMLTSAVAVASGVFQPDPGDVASILDEAEEAGRHAAKTEGWRPTLRTEQVWCAYEDGTVGSTRSTDFDLDEPMTEQDLLDACVGGPDEARHRGLDTAVDYTFCEAVTDPADLQALLGNPDFAPQVVDGEISDDRPGFPVLLGWQADCAEARIATTPAVTLQPLTSLAAVNRAREIEIGLTASALQECLTHDQATALAREAAAGLEGDWVVVDGPEVAHGAACHRVWLEPRRGVLFIDGAARGSSVSE